MTTFVCAELLNGSCALWVERADFLPPLSMAQGAELGALVLLCYATSWGISLVAKQLMPR